MKLLKGISIILFVSFSSLAFAEAISIDDESFGVFYESPMNSNKGLILYISNKNCFGSYRIANNEQVIASGDVNARGPEKTVQFGTARFRIDCGPLQSLVITRK